MPRIGPFDSAWLGKGFGLGDFSIAETHQNFKDFTPGGEGSAVVLLVLLHGVHEYQFFVCVFRLACSRMGFLRSIASPPREVISHRLYQDMHIIVLQK